MIFGLHGNENKLSEELSEAQLQLDRRRRALHDDVDALEAAIHRRITAPGTLLWSAGIGFGIGELTKKRVVQPTAHASEHAAAQEEEAPGTFQLLLRYIAIARPIITTAISLLTPYLQQKQIDAAEQAHQDAVMAAMNDAATTDGMQQPA